MADDGATLVPTAFIDDIMAEAPEQERLESGIMGEVERGAALPGLYPPNAENQARYERAKKWGSSPNCREVLPDGGPAAVGFARASGGGPDRR